MSSPVSVSELRATVTRMEERFRQRRDTLTVRLLTAYDKLVPRFRSDLNDERDELLSRGGALMLIQEAVDEKP